MRQLLRQGWILLDRLTTPAGELTRRSRQIIAEIEAGDARVKAGELESAAAFYTEKLSAARSARDSWRTSILALALGGVATRLLDEETARACFTESADLLRKAGSPEKAASAVLSMAVLEFGRSDFAQAHSVAEEALHLWRSAKIPGSEWRALLLLSNIASIRGEYAAARSYLEDCDRMVEGSDDPLKKAATPLMRGTLTSAEANGESPDDGVAVADAVAAARSHIEESLRRYRELEDRDGIMAALTSLGFITLRNPQEGSAENGSRGYGAEQAYLDEALGLARAQNDVRTVSYALNNLARLARFNGDPAESERLYAESLSLKRTMGRSGDRWGAIYTLEGLAALAIDSGAPERAARLLGAAASQRESLGTPMEGFLRPEHRRVVAQSRAALTPEVFARTFESGSRAPWNDTLEYALRIATHDGLTPAPVIER